MTHRTRTFTRSAVLLAIIGSLSVIALADLAEAEAEAGGALLVTIRSGGGSAKGQVVVTTSEAEPREVAKGPTGRPLGLPPGTYDVSVTCTDLVDQPTLTLDDVAVAGETVEREVSFPSGEITLFIRQGGRVLKNKALRIVPEGGGEAFPGKAYSGKAFKITPGHYEAEITLGRKVKHSITGIQAYEGARRQIPVDL